MVVNEKHDVWMRPVHLKFGVALAISAGGILSAFLAIRNIKRKSRRSGIHGNVSKSSPHPSSGNENKSHEENRDELRQEDLALLDYGSLSDRSSCGSRDGLLLPEFNEVLQECNAALTTATVSPTMSEYRGDGLFSTNLYTHETNQELQQLLDGNNRLRMHNMDDTVYNLKIESLVSHNKRLETKLGDYGRLMSELEAEKTTTKILRRKLRAGAEQAVEDILTPRVQSDHDLNSNRLKEHLEEMMNSNRALKQENSELLHKLEYVQMLATSALETEEMHELRVERQRLRQQNEELMKEMERIQGERWSDVEELVHLRWINACLRYEVRNQKAIGGDGKKMLSPKSEERLKRVIMESGYGTRMDMATDLDSDHGSSAQSCLTDDESSSSAADKSSKTKVLSKLRRLLKGKGSSKKKEEAAATRSNSRIARTVSLSSYNRDELMMNSSSSRSTSRASSRRSLELPRISEKSVSSSNGSMRMSDVSSSLLTRINSLSEVDEHEWPLPMELHHDAKQELLNYAQTLNNSRRKSSS